MLFILEKNLLKELNLFLEQYKYLGVVFQEYFDYNFCEDHIAASASRALGAAISKFKTMKNVGIKIFTQLFNAMVILSLTTAQVYGRMVTSHNYLTPRIGLFAISWVCIERPPGWFTRGGRVVDTKVQTVFVYS